MSPLVFGEMGFSKLLFGEPCFSKVFKTTRNNLFHVTTSTVKNSARNVHGMAKRHSLLIL